MLTAKDFAVHSTSSPEAKRRAAVPERPVHWPWLHGAVVPEVSPRQVAERTAASKPADRWWD